MLAEAPALELAPVEHEDGIGLDDVGGSGGDPRSARSPSSAALTPCAR